MQAAEQLPDAPSIDARAWILMDYASGKVLSEDLGAGQVIRGVRIENPFI